MEEILPRIREELGPDAVITRRREGVTGGVGGFFAKRCVEVEARGPSVILPPPAVPRKTVIDVYDTPFEPVALDTPYEDLAFAVTRLHNAVEDVAPSTPFDEITLTAPVNGIALASPLDDLAFAQPVEDIAPSTPFDDITLTAPADELTLVTPFEDALAAAAGGVARIAAPADDLAPPAPANDIALATPVNDLAFATPVDHGGHNGRLSDETEPQLSENALLEILLAQTSPFADEVAEPVERTEPVDEHSDRDDVGYDDAVISLLLAGGISPAMAHAILGDAQRELAPFAPDTPLRTLARRTLAQRLTVRHGTRSKHRTIALVGPPGSGKTLTAAKLCNVYATSGQSVAAVSLEPARKAVRLAMFTDMVDVNLEIADATKLISHARERTADASIVIADTPAIDLRKRTSFTKLARLLEALEPDETHLLLPADWSVEDGRALIDAAGESLSINRMLITHADRPAPIGAAVGLSLATKLPVSYVSESALTTGGIRPADPKQLARMVL